MKVIIIGSGHSAIAAVNEFNKNSNVEALCITRDKQIAYVKEGLAKILDVENSFTEQNLFYDNVANYKNVKFELESEVTNVDPENKTLTYKKNSNKIQVSYDKLIIASGTSGDKKQSLKGLYNDYSLEVQTKVLNDVSNMNLSKVAIIGSNLSGMGILSSILTWNKKVYLIENRNNIFPYLQNETIKDEFKRILDFYNVETYVNDNVEQISRDKDLEITLKSGNKINVDIIIDTTKTRANTSFINCNKDENNLIKVDKNFATNCNDVFAIGEVAKLVDNKHLSSISSAKLMGESVAKNILNDEYKCIDKFSNAKVSKVFSYNIYSVGFLNEVNKLQDFKLKLNFFDKKIKIKGKICLNQDLTINYVELISKENISFFNDLLTLCYVKNINLKQLQSIDFNDNKNNNWVESLINQLGDSNEI